MYAFLFLSFVLGQVVLGETTLWSDEWFQQTQTGVHIHSSRRGEGAHHVVLLHGYPNDAPFHDWVDELGRFDDNTYHIVDQRGYAPSSQPRAGYRVEELVEDVVNVIDQVDGPVTLIGHDLGGIVAQGVASTQPS